MSGHVCTTKLRPKGPGLQLEAFCSCCCHGRKCAPAVMVLGGVPHFGIYVMEKGEGHRKAVPGWLISNL